MGPSNPWDPFLRGRIAMNYSVPKKFKDRLFEEVWKKNHRVKNLFISSDSETNKIALMIYFNDFSEKKIPLDPYLIKNDSINYLTFILNQI